MKGWGELQPQQYFWLLGGVTLFLIALVVAAYYLKKILGAQGWRKQGGWGIAWGMQRVSRGVGWVKKRLPWKPMLIWGPWVLMGLVAGFYGVENWRGEREWERVRGEFEGRGEKLLVEEFLPESIPDEENFALHPAVLTEVASANSLGGLRDLGLPEFSTSFTGYGTGQPNLGQRRNVDDWLDVSERTGDERRSAERIIELIKPVQGRMAGVAEAARRSGCRFEQQMDPKDFLGGWNDPLRFQLLGFSKMFSQRMLVRLRAGDGTGAAEDLETVLLFAEKSGADPTLLGILIRGAIIRAAENLVWDGLQTGLWDEGQLQRLENRLGEIDLRREGLRSMRCEVAYWVELYTGLAEGTYAMSDLTALVPLSPLQWMTWSGSPGWWDDGVESAEGLLLRLMPSGWFRAWLADGILRMDRAVLRPGGVAAERLEVGMGAALEREAEELEEAFMGELRSASLSGLGSFVSRLFLVQERVDLMRVAVGLERYRMRTGEYPRALEDLVPGELVVVPRDVVSGEALRYRIKADGTPLIYGVGLNGVDDGGVPARNQDDLDWVWQYTATVGQTEQMWGRGRKP